MNFEVLYYKGRKGHWHARVRIEKEEFYVGPFGRLCNLMSMVAWLTAGERDEDSF